MKKLTWLMVLGIAWGAAALSKGKATYMGGTITAVKDQTDGKIDYQHEARLAFTPDKGTPIEIPWASVSEVEYGQKAGRRIVQALVLSPFSLFAKNRKHYVTFNWTDGSGAQQAVVLQFDKNDIRQALAVIRARTGKEITFTDEEAQKQMGGSGKKAAPAAAASGAPAAAPAPEATPTPTPQT